MKKILILSISFLVFFSSFTFGQEGASEPTISFKGFVKLDAILDTRQTVAAREGHFLLYPSNEAKDRNGKVYNDVLNLNMLAIQTRLTMAMKGPDAFGAKTSGTIEGAFFGHSNADVNGFRLRHAFVKLDWGETNLTFGQTWHPMFVTACFPGVVNFNTGVPFQPFSRNPQIRLTHKLGQASLIAAIMSQRDFTSPGGSTSLRNAGIPNAHFQLQLKAGDHILGAGADYKMLRPKLISDSLVQTDETVSGISFIGYGKFKFGKATIKVEGILGQNLYDHLMLGGYAVKEYDNATGKEMYTTLNNMSVWTDLSFGKEFAPGLFVAYQKNQGASDDIGGSIYARGSNIDNILRVSPRLVWNSGKTRIATELDYTAAAYGITKIDGTVTDTESIANIRFLFAVYYFFKK